MVGVAGGGSVAHPAIARAQRVGKTALSGNAAPNRAKGKAARIISQVATIAPRIARCKSDGLIEAGHLPS